MRPSSVDEPIRADGVCKRYGRRQAVTDLSFAVRRGQVCALLGPNGAGKTTTMRMLVGLARPDRGRADLLGHPVHLGTRTLRRLGVLIDGPAFVPHLSGLANLRLLWSASGRDWPPPALDPALDLAGLGPAIDRKARSYSMGMRQRLMLAQALMRAPDVLVLDEPANGLDPAEVRALRHRLAALAGDGVAVLVSSHQLAEVQQLATHAVVLNRGQLVASGALADLLAGTDTHRIDVNDTTRALTVLRGVAGVTAVDARDTTITVTAPGVAAADLVQALVTAGIGVVAVRRADRSLEEAFLTITEGDRA